MKESLKTGFSFGLTSGIITTLGLMVGLHSGTHLKLAVIGGVLTIAIADAFSDALGIHITEEAKHKQPTKEVWEATVFTFITKFFFALTFLVPLIVFDLSAAMIISIVYGLSLLGLFSFYIGLEQGDNPWAVAGEHLLIAAVVITITHFVGDWIRLLFG